MKTWWIRKVALFLLLAVVAASAFGALVMLLWNATVPQLFHGPEITFVQAIALLVLAHILLRGWSPWRYGHSWRRERWRHRFEEKLASMSPEERARFRRHGPCAPDEEEKTKV
ncbi:MAG TPA: hypothetical protein VL126_10275 [Bacteroidota bacterium]|nr:hypothetical protein [Bacteroidota bacterium]